MAVIPTTPRRIYLSSPHISGREQTLETVADFIVNRSGRPARRVGRAVAGQGSQQVAALFTGDLPGARAVSSWIGQ